METIESMYKEGYSSIEIGEKLGRNPRQIQRIVAKLGLTRDSKERYNNAIKRGRRVYTRLPKEELKQRKQLGIKLRYKVLNAFSFRCVSCGITAREARIEIDHVDGNPSNNEESNLQVLCETCNKGKAYNM